jgi:hypothetical protein
LSLWTKLVTEFPVVQGYRVKLAGCHDSLGHRIRDTGQAEKAAQAYGQALATWRQLAVDFPNDRRYPEGLTFTAFKTARPVD